MYSINATQNEMFKVQEDGGDGDLIEESSQKSDQIENSEEDSEIDQSLSILEYADDRHKYSSINTKKMKAWKSTLISSGMGSFLTSTILYDKLKLALSKHGLVSAEPDCFGAIIDSSEHLMKELVGDLIMKARSRMQEQQPNMM